MSEDSLNEIKVAFEFTKNFAEQNIFNYFNRAAVTKNFEGQAKNYVKKAFKENKPHLMAGGWVGGGRGHAMYYEIIPSGNGKATFRLFNLGGGSQNHAVGVVGNKEKALPYFDFTGVSKDILLQSQTLKLLENC